MSFVWFRRYHKPFLWFAVIFTIIVFATFSGLGDFNLILQRTSDGNALAQFTIAGSGEIRMVLPEEFARVRTAMNRWAYVNQRDAKVEDDDVWTHLMLVADARAAGLQVADSEIGRIFPPTWTKEDYRRFWFDQMQFPSARDFEDFIRELLLSARIEQVTEQAARIVDADEIYLRWRTDTELFDIEAIVFPDLPLEQIADPTADELQKYWDDMPAPQRDARFVEPQKQDIVYAWWPLDGSDGVPDETLAATELAEPSPEEVLARFNQTKADRWPDLAEPDDAATAVLVREGKLMTLAQQAADAFEAREDKSAATFTEALGAAGLRVVNPEGELGPEQIKALEGIGDEYLPLWLGQRSAGDVHFGYPYSGQNHVEVVYLETVTPSRPLGFDEAHDQVVKAWKELRRDKVAKDFRELLRTRTRERPEVAEIITPVVEAAERRADEEVAARAELDEAGRTALRKQLLDTAEQQDIVPRIAEYEHITWAELPLAEGARKLEFTGVPHNYPSKPTGEEVASSIERFLKTNGVVFRMGVDAISEPMRHGPSSQTVIVRVTGRSFLDKAAMLADHDGLEVSRKQLQLQRQNEARQAFLPEQLKQSHDLKILKQGLVN